MLVSGELPGSIKLEIFSPYPSLKDITQFSCGDYHVAFVDSNGDVYLIGDLLGNNAESGAMKVPGLPKISKVSCGVSKVICLDREGYVHTFGSRDLGRGIVRGVPSPPALLPNVKDIYSLSQGCGASHTIIKATDGNMALGRTNIAS